MATRIDYDGMASASRSFFGGEAASTVGGQRCVGTLLSSRACEDNELDPVSDVDIGFVDSNLPDIHGAIGVVWSVRRMSWSLPILATALFGALAVVSFCRRFGLAEKANLAMKISMTTLAGGGVVLLGVNGCFPVKRWVAIAAPEEGDA